jgi:hypothetical protein
MGAEEISLILSQDWRSRTAILANLAAASAVTLSRVWLGSNLSGCRKQLRNSSRASTERSSATG